MNEESTTKEPVPTVTMGSRRAWLLGTTMAAVAGAAGVGAAWWRRDSSPRPELVGASLWQMSFAAPQGASISMRDFRGRALLLNFWATWCPPCVEELPMLDRFSRQLAGKGLQIIGLAIDKPDSVRRFLQRTPVAFPIGLAGFEGADLGKSLGNTEGGLPFTVVVGADGKVIGRKLGRLAEQDLQAWSRSV